MHSMNVCSIRIYTFIYFLYLYMKWMKTFSKKSPRQFPACCGRAPVPFIPFHFVSDADGSFSVQFAEEVLKWVI